MNKTDWRLQGQESYLQGKTFIMKKYSGKPTWDHDHCEFCCAKISSNAEDINEAYTTEDNKHWICKRCFEDFANLIR